MADPLAALPNWRCHKVVRAARIAAMMPHPTGMTLTLEWDAADRLGTYWYKHDVDQTWIDHHKPLIGGYLVVYADGYTSFSPAEAFETGYDRVE